MALNFEKVTYVDGQTVIGADNLNATQDAILALDSNKVEKENGKGLSSNDYTNQEKQKLGNIDPNDYVQKEQGKGLSTNDYTTAEKQKLASTNPENYVQKEQGKGLSTNDYTNAEKQKLTNLENSLNDFGEDLVETENEVRDLKGALENNALNYNLGSVMFSALHNFYVDTDGTLKPLEGFCATDYIPLATSSITIISPVAQYDNYSSFYNANKEQISNFRFLADENIIDVPSGAKYVRLTIQERYLNDTIMLTPPSEEVRPWAEIGVDTLRFAEGYYDLNTGMPTQNILYKRSQIIACNDWTKLININQFVQSSDYASLWLDDVYVGYELTANGVTSETYNRVALNYQPAKHVEIKLTYTNPFYTEPVINSPFKDLSIGFLGDSITYGVGASDRNTKSYVALMRQQFKQVLNYGISSTLIAEESGYSNAMCDRYVNMSDDLDIVVVYGGTNDWYYGTAWGSVDSVDKTTFLGALNVLMSGLVQKYCGKEIFFVTPMSSNFNNRNTDDQNACGKTMLDYRNAIIERATYHAIPVIDLYAMCNMDVAHNSANKTYYSADGVHPNDAGHKRVHDRIVAILRDYLVF